MLVRLADLAFDLPPYVVHPVRVPRNPHTLFPPGSHCSGLLQIHILHPRNRAMESIAVLPRIDSKKGSVQSLNTINVMASAYT